MLGAQFVCTLCGTRALPQVLTDIEFGVAQAALMMQPKQYTNVGAILKALSWRSCSTLIVTVVPCACMCSARVGA